MEAFYFGPSDTYLFGIFHPPQNGNRREGIVLCNPFGQEYMRAHRSLRRLAIELAKLGYSVLRFDYRGTGDSAASLDSVTAADWLEDIGHAVQELIDIAAVPKVTLLGLRMGGLLAAHVAAHHPSVTRLLLWDPAMSGHEYIEELRQNITARSDKPSRTKFVAADGALHFNGFCLSKEFQRSLLTLDSCAPAGLEAKTIAQIISHDTPGFTAFRELLCKSPKYHHRLAPAPHDWNYVDHVGGILWPAPILDAIEQYFSSSL